VQCASPELPDLPARRASGSHWLRWFLVLTKASSEQLAVTHLARQGFETYLPRLQRRALRRSRWVDRVVALFPRYVFVRLDTRSQVLAPIRSTRGVAGVVKFGDEVAIVPDGVVETLMSRADPESGLHRLADERPRRGTKVSVIDGPLAGLEGIFDRDTGEERAVILLSLLGRSTPVCVNSAFVVAA
jgi:transcriptional antiterminator RfaH